MRLSLNRKPFRRFPIRDPISRGWPAGLAERPGPPDQRKDRSLTLRKRSGAIICPQCRRLVDVRDARCPHCGRGQPGLWGYGPGLGRALAQVDVTRVLIMACVLLYGGTLLADLGGALAPRGLMNLLSPSSRALYAFGMTGGLAWARGDYWTILSAIYLHGSLLHLVFNFMWIRDLGPAVESIYGPARAFLLYTIAGAGGFLASNLISGVPTVGASGAIFGLLAALIVHGRRSGRSLLSSQLVTWAVVLFVSGFLFPGVNNFAHAGGFGAGWVAAHGMGGGTTEEGPLTTGLAILAAVASLGAILASLLRSF
jgi:rhomboid protease GluP